MSGYSSSQSSAFVALLREAGIASSMLGSGVTLLGQASPWHHGKYNQAFFELSIGLERLAKLIIVVEHAATHTGSFPDNKVLKNHYRHGIRILLQDVQMLGATYLRGHEYGAPPQTDIHRAIIDVLSCFAERTRYYNLDLLTRGGARPEEDPVAAWYGCVGKLILDKHYTSRQRARDAQLAQVFEDVMGPVTLVRHKREDGSTVNTVRDASLMHSHSRLVGTYGRLYTLQIVRHLTCLLWEVECEAHRRSLSDIPYLHEFFGIFYNDDHYFRRRKTWLPYSG